MVRSATSRAFTSSPDPLAAIELLKPITWFPPMWAFACGLVCTTGAHSVAIWQIALGVALTGPIVCGGSQAVNDWFDRDVDAINEPHRPIPSGRLPGRWGLYIAVAWTVLGVVASLPLGTFARATTLVGLLFSWLYSAPPVRLKLNGWWGNSVVAGCYEGLPWVTGAAIAAGTAPGTDVVLIAALYSLGAHGIMTLNDFKSIVGDRLTGVRSLPVQLGARKAALVACWVMAAAQVGVGLLLLRWHQTLFALAIGLLLFLQVVLMRRLIQRPRELAPWYNGTGVTLYVSGMMLSAVALRTMGTP